MGGIPRPMIEPLRATLLQCDEFDSPRLLRAVFIDDRLAPWRDSLPGADTRRELVDRTIDFLWPKRSRAGENALVLLLAVLVKRYDSQDARYAELAALAQRLGEL